ncbi:MAG: Eco57I restriction-modification methylase domain-containing protein [Verrucomicrobia bacterium]|nr:Eco57I restriction-modification methylase domain-containing protein [Verrucomicrobiota bacterium]
MPPSPHLPDIANAAALLAFLRDGLDWPIPDDALADELTFDWTGDDLRLSDTAAQRLTGGTIRQLRPLIAGQPWGVFLVEFADAQVYRTALRQILRGLVPNRRRNPSLQAWQHDNLLFICATSDYQRISFAHFRGEQAGRARLATFGWRRGATYARTLFEHNLPHLHWPEDDGADAAGWLKAWAKAFDKEPLTKEFFKRFDAALDAVKADLEKCQSLKPAEAYSRAQLLLERLIFLYYLQNRGWLDQKRDFLLANFQLHRKRGNDFSYYEDFLEKLFWTLASAPGSSDRLTGIPFLNGGLFDDDEFAPTPLRRKHNPPLRVRNATFAAVFDQLLEAFNFTVREDTPLNQDVAVDPEMLGKVFESIVLHAEAADPDAVAPDKRKATGSYYTPRIVVHFICRESLRQYLLNHLPGDGWAPKLKDLFEIDATDGLDPDELASLRGILTPAEGKQIAELVQRLKTCDPAVGSGAFPVGLLQELVSLRRIAEAAANGYVDPFRKQGAAWLHDTKAQIVADCLYGVDIQQQAIEICRLRLWLSLVVDYDLGVDPFVADRAQFQQAIGRISQLPNLEMNFHRGDSLLDHVCGVHALVAPDRASDYADDIARIQKLGAELHKARKADRKRKLRLDLLARRLDLSQRVVEDESKRLRSNQQVGDLFGDVGSDAEKRRRAEAEIKQLEEALQKIAADRKTLQKLEAGQFASDFYARLRRLEGADFDSPFNFAWHIDFAEIFHPRLPTKTIAGNLNLGDELTPAQRGGFDLIVGNPPFVTARNPKKRESYRERWPVVCHREYELVSPFFQASFGFLRPRGELGFIVSNGFMMRDFGKPLIEDFFPTVHLQKIIDCDGLSFPGHGTPTCIVFGRSPEQGETIEQLTKHAVRIAGRLPGGGDLRTVPEESPLWASLQQHHDDPGYTDERIAVAERSMADLAKWPLKLDASGQSTQQKLEAGAAQLADFIESCGSMFDTHKDDAFVLSGHVVRKVGIERSFLVPFVPGDQLRNWLVFDGEFVLKPYDDKWKLLEEDRKTGLFKWLRMMKQELGGRATFGGQTYLKAGEPWFRFHQMSVPKITAKLTVSYPEIATHAHFIPLHQGRLLPQTAPVLQLPKDDDGHACLLAGVLNSNSVLFWLKQVSFNKGAGKDEQLDRFEFQGKRIKQTPIPPLIAEPLRGKPNALAERLTALSRSCWERGRQMPSLALAKLFEKDGEAYHAWNASLPGHVPAAAEFAPPFAATGDLRARLAAATARREQLRAEMIGSQEEMDWLVYAAYGLLPAEHPAVAAVSDRRIPEPGGQRPPLQESDRPFRFWAAADGDFAKAVALIPADWPAERRQLWQARLAAIRDNEHIRRIEAPVYKRRWDEQWKVGNRWTAGPAAYAQELADAFRGWLAEKAEWHLEHKANGGPLALDTWCAALWKDPRIQAAWPVVAEAINRVELHKIELGGKKPKLMPEADPSAAAFARFLRNTINDETVPEGIPPAVPWEELEKKMDVPKRAIAVRGKLNVPRERFQARKDGAYVWAGKK